MTKLKNSLKFVLEGISIVLVESTEYETKPNPPNQKTPNPFHSFWSCFHWEAEKYCALFWGYLTDLNESCSFDAGSFSIEKMQFNFKEIKLFLHFCFEHV